MSTAPMLNDDRRHWLMIAGLTAVSVMLRAAVAFRGGIWSDEGFFLSVIEIPSWTAMLEFLRLHESHPPLFYALMKIWGSITGFDERAMLVLPIMLGAAMTPVTYIVCHALHSSRAGVIAAVIVTFSAGMVEYSGQIRPYCILPTLILLSCAAFVQAIERRTLRAWMRYALWTILGLYTHNWVWLIVAGQVVAFGVVLSRTPGGAGGLIAQFASSWAAIFALYLPWLSAFLFQATHAGHPPFLVDRGAGVIGLYAYGVLSAPAMLLFGTPPDGMRFVIVCAAVVAVIAALAALRISTRASRTSRRRRESVQCSRGHTPVAARETHLRRSAAGIIWRSSRLTLRRPVTTGWSPSCEN